tara:strand:- start:5456 stop:5980 length:525 start_codon:yes stop_codon:yes gene_type:complete
MRKVLIWILLILFSGAGLGLYFYQNYQDDRTPTRNVNAGRMSVREAVTKLEVASFNMGYVGSILSYISRCRRFPESFQGFYKPIEEDNPQYCEPLKSTGNRHNWLDPWGRPYQIRYDRERAKMQIRSLGRYWWWPWDNIQDETYFDGKLYQEQIKLCDQVVKSDMSCIFNRGWH